MAQADLLTVNPISQFKFSLFDKNGDGGKVGGWQPIENIKDPHVIEIGEFAVTEHNKEAKTQLKFESVIKGWTQVVAGVNYKLILAANDGTGTKNYEAIVWEKSWENFKELTSFKPYPYPI